MEARYICPHCRSTLNIEKDIILTAKNSKGKKGIIMFHTELGNYSSKKSPEFELFDDKEMDLYCPVCSGNLEYQFKPTLASIIRIDENNKESVIVFSKILGEQSTYQIIDKKVISYGENAKKYSDPEWFL